MNMENMKVISKKEWLSKKEMGYTSIINGQKYAMFLIDGGTCLVPIKIKKDGE